MNILLLICYLGFISLGLPDAVLGIAWPSVRETFSLKQCAAAWIFAGVGCSYLLSTLLTGRLLQRTSIGVVLGVSTSLAALAAFNYGIAPFWILFALGSVLHGLGSGAVDTGLNYYVSKNFAARHMQWLHACYTLGALLGPLIMTQIIAAGAPWRRGYFIVAGALGLLALLFFVTRKRWGAGPAQEPAQNSAEVRSKQRGFREIFSIEPAVLHMVLFFVYVGIEVSISQWTFTVCTESRGMLAESAGFLVTLYWASLLTGRVVFGFIVERLGVDLLLRMSMLAVVLGTVLFAANVAPQAAIVLSGLGLASIYPGLMTRTPERFRDDIAVQLIGFQVAAGTLGAAFLPGAAGIIGQFGGLHLVGPAIALMALTLFAAHERVTRYRAESL
jgi:fucose permease